MTRETVRIEGTGGFAGASDYRIRTSGPGEIEKAGRLEIGDSISDDGQTASGQVVRGIDRWLVPTPFEVVNLSKSPVGPPPAIIVETCGQSFRVEAARALRVASCEAINGVEDRPERGRDRGLVGFLVENPALAIGLALAAIVVSR